MKKILFVIGNMEIGGTRSSLLNLLNLLSKDQDFTIDLFILSHHGELFDRIPESVNVLSENFFISNSLPRKQKQSIIARIYHVVFYLCKLLIGYERIFSPIFSRVAQQIERENSEYDAVFGYQEGICNFFASFIHSKKHYMWIHSDVNSWFDRSVFYSKAYDNADKIIFVAEATKELFCDFLDEYRDKCIVIKNALDTALITKKSQTLENSADYFDNKITLVSLGRLSEEKGFLRIPAVAKKLLESGIEFKWFIIGDGKQKETILSAIRKNNLNSTVILLGSMNNPYPIMKNSDLLVVTSYNESQPMVIIEALTLGTPVLTTRYPSAKEVLDGKEYGIMCDNSEDDLYRCLFGLMKDKKRISDMKKIANNYVYSNFEIISYIKELC